MFMYKNWRSLFMQNPREAVPLFLRDARLASMDVFYWTMMQWYVSRRTKLER